MTRIPLALARRAEVLGFHVEYKPIVRRHGWPEASHRPFHLHGHGRVRYFRHLASVERELAHAENLRQAVKDAEAARAAPGRPGSAVDTHAGKVAYAKANKTCFACRAYSAPLSRLTGYCRIGGPAEWGDADQLISWANTCSRFEPAKD